MEVSGEFAFPRARRERGMGKQKRAHATLILEMVPWRKFQPSGTSVHPHRVSNRPGAGQRLHQAHAILSRYFVLGNV